MSETWYCDRLHLHLYLLYESILSYGCAENVNIATVQYWHNVWKFSGTRSLYQLELTPRYRFSRADENYSASPETSKPVENLLQRFILIYILGNI